MSSYVMTGPDPELELALTTLCSSSPRTHESESFAYFLIDRGVLELPQLIEAIRLQLNEPGSDICECLAALGLCSYERAKALYNDWRQAAAELELSLSDVSFVGV